MILFTHIVCALSSLIFSAYLYVRPSRTKLRASYALITGTAASGVALVITTHSAILGSCFAGATFIVVTLSATQLASRKLVHVVADSGRMAIPKGNKL